MLYLADLTKILVSGKLQAYHKGQEPGSEIPGFQAVKNQPQQEERQLGMEFQMLSS